MKTVNRLLMKSIRLQKQNNIRRNYLEYCPMKIKNYTQIFSQKLYSIRSGFFSSHVNLKRHGIAAKVFC